MAGMVQQGGWPFRVDGHFGVHGASDTEGGFDDEESQALEAALTAEVERFLWAASQDASSAQGTVPEHGGPSATQ